MTLRRVLPVLAVVAAVGGGAVATDTLTVAERLQLVGGQPCERVYQRDRWWASPKAVEGCLQLGCARSPVALDEAVGVCGVAAADEDCAGQLRRTDGSCGSPPTPHEVYARVRAARSLVTASALWLSDVDGPWAVKPQMMAGAFYQIAPCRSQAFRGPDGVLTHVGVPRTLVHLGVHGMTGGRQLVGGEVGLVRRLDGRLLTRAALLAIGQWHATGSLLGNGASYRLGPAAHLEVMSNLIAKVGYLHDVGGPGDPAFLVGAEYGRFLRDDLWLHP